MVDGQPGKIAKLLIMKTANPFEIENKFYETSDVDRISKLIVHFRFQVLNQINQNSYLHKLEKK